MKKMILSLSMFVLSTSVFAAGHNYQCIADKLQAYNSDYYYELTPAEIDNILNSSSDIRTKKVQQVAKECDPKSATFTELVRAEVAACIPEAGNPCQGETEIVLKSVMTTKLEVTSSDKNLINLKASKLTTWKPGSQFIDVKNITVDLGSNNGRDALVTVFEASASGMGGKTTRLVMDCFKRAEALRCELETKKSVLKLVIAE